MIGVTEPLLMTMTQAARVLGMGVPAARRFCEHHGCLVDDGAGGVRVSRAALTAATSGEQARARRIRSMPRVDLSAPGK